MRLNPLLSLALLASLLTSACQPSQATPSLSVSPLPPLTPKPFYTDTPISTPTTVSTATPIPLVPNFKHIAIIVFENKEFGTVIGNRNMPYFNILASSYTLLTQHYAIMHPSLPNYLSMIGGDTFGIVDNCEDCFIDVQSLPDLIEESGRTWKTYQDNMPEPCFIGSTLRYDQKHNPFIYFDPIRLDIERCREHIVPLTDMDADIASRSLPNFIFVTPDICYSSHDCTLELTDGWLHELMDKLVPALDATDEPYLVILTWDEGQGNHSCCGLPESAGGRIATILISPQVKIAFQDATPYTHYSLLKTIAEAWGLPYLGHAADEENVIITVPWK